MRALLLLLLVFATGCAAKPTRLVREWDDFALREPSWTIAASGSFVIARAVFLECAARGVSEPRVERFDGLFVRRALACDARSTHSCEARVRDDGEIAFSLIRPPAIEHGLRFRTEARLYLHVNLVAGKVRRLDLVGGDRSSDRVTVCSFELPDEGAAAFVLLVPRGLVGHYLPPESPDEPGRTPRVLVAIVDLRALRPL